MDQAVTQKKRGRPLNGPFLWLMNLVLNIKSIFSIITSNLGHHKEADELEDANIRVALAFARSLEALANDPRAVRDCARTIAQLLDQSIIWDEIADGFIEGISDANDRGKEHATEAYVIAERHLDFVPAAKERDPHRGEV